MKLEEKVKNDVARLLAMIANDGTDPDTYEFVLKKLTRMVILGTLPAGSEPRGKKPPAKYDDSHSEDKERWIAR
jgi:hypothetical protein